MSEDEGKPHAAQKKAGKQKKARAWLKEGEEDDPLNFLDPKVSQRVLGKTIFVLFLMGAVCLWFRFWIILYNVFYFCFSATNPELKKSAKADHGFKVTSDGRLIIREDDEEDVKDKG